MAAVSEADHGGSAINLGERGTDSRIDPEAFREDLRIMQIAYGVMLTLGFRVIAEAYHSVLVNWKNHGWAIDAQFLLVTMVTLSISLLGTRFFFATNNIRRYIAAWTLKNEDVVRGRVVMIHFPILMLHSFVFFALAKTYESLCGSSVSIRHLDHVIGAFGVMLVLNVLWLALLLRGRTKSRPEGTWMWINAGTLIALAVLLAPVFFPRLSWFDLASRSYQHPQLWCAVGVMLLNSVLNMGFATGAYMNKTAAIR